MKKVIICKKFLAKGVKHIIESMFKETIHPLFIAKVKM